MASTVSSPEPIRLKIIIVGEAGVGKTSMVRRFIDEKFEHNRPSTIGADYYEKVVDLNGELVHLGIWDTAGQERFRAITNSLYRGVHGALLCYAHDNFDSMEKISWWKNELELKGIKNVLVVGNKVDKKNDSSTLKIYDAMHRIALPFMEVSAKTGDSINEAFETVAQYALDDYRLPLLEVGELKLDNPQSRKWCAC